MNPLQSRTDECSALRPAVRSCACGNGLADALEQQASLTALYRYGAWDPTKALQLRYQAPFFLLQQIIQLLKEPKKLFWILLVLDQSAEPSHFVEFFRVHWKLLGQRKRLEHWSH